MEKESLSQYKGNIDFGIITIKAEEFEALLEQFEPTTYLEGRRYYHISKVIAQNGSEYNVAITPCSEQGNGEAQNLTNDLIEDLDPNWILLVGIGGGVPDSEFSLGDVVLGSRLQDYSLSAASEDKLEFDNTGGPMKKEVQNLIASLPAFKNVLQGWNEINIAVPVVDHANSDNYYGPDSYQEKLKSLIEGRFGIESNIRLPKFVIGSIASSDTLVKDTELIDTWKLTARKLKVVEMELAGVYRAARRKEKEYPVLAIRGISDIVGFKRHEDWTLFACKTAASFAKYFIGSGIVKKK